MGWWEFEACIRAYKLANSAPQGPKAPTPAQFLEAVAADHTLH